LQTQVRPAVVVFRPRAGAWLGRWALTLVIAFNSLYWFFDPVPMIVRYFGAVVIICWVSYLASFARARVELRETSVEIRGPSLQLLHPRELHWLYTRILFPLVIFDLAALFFGPLPLLARRFLLGIRFVWLLAYLWCFGALQGGLRSIKYAEITTAPWESRLTPTAISTVLRLETSSSTNPFTFPSWLNAGDQREVAGRVTARMKHAHAIQNAREAKQRDTADGADVPAPASGG
jgi:hypothetical protein